MFKKMIVTSLLVQSERNFFCSDTGALVEESTTRFHPYKKYAFYSSFSILFEYYNFDFPYFLITVALFIDWIWKIIATLQSLLYKTIQSSLKIRFAGIQTLTIFSPFWEKYAILFSFRNSRVNYLVANFRVIVFGQCYLHYPILIFPSRIQKCPLCTPVQTITAPSFFIY
jgi:hypothetical protein